MQADSTHINRQPCAPSPPALQNVQRQLSCWLRGHVTVYSNYGAANSSLVQFFKQQGAVARKVGRQAML